MFYAILADVVVFFHIAYVSYVLFGQLIVMFGWMCNWQWIRNLWFRASHLVMILIVALEAIFGVECPMTDWEHELRVKAGQEAAEGTFIGRLLHDLLFYDAPSDHPAFLVCYVGFAVLVVAFFVLAPPRVNFAPYLLLVGILGVMALVFLLFVATAEGRYIGLGLLAGAGCVWVVGRYRQTKNPVLEDRASDA